MPRRFYVAELILQASRPFTHVTAHSPTLPSLYIRRSSFSNPSVASPTSQLILKPFFRFSYVTVSSLTSPGEPPMIDMIFHSPTLPSLHLHHSSFSNPSIASPISQALHLCLLVSCPYFEVKHSTFFCISLRACIIILSMDFTINKLIIIF